MSSDSPKHSDSKPEAGIITRFAHLLSAQTVDGIGSGLFFLYLAWLDTTLYGEVMYAMAAAGIVAKIVQFGLYYPLVAQLGGASKEVAAEALNRVNVIKIWLTMASIIGVATMAIYRGFSPRMTWILILVCLGWVLEALAETFFADLRVRGRQDKEARIKIIAAIASYSFGAATAALGLGPILVSLFKIVSGAVRAWYGLSSYVSYYATSAYRNPEWGPVWAMFKAASVFAVIEILGVVYNKTNIFFLEDATGVKGVAYYSAAYGIVDPISILASEQFLGWVIFPLLASLWWKNQAQVGRLVRRNAQWLLALALPIMFLLHEESGLIIGLIYRPEFKDAVWIQQYLVWTILLSFESNLFCYVMMIAGAGKVLLLFAVVGTILNMVFNLTLVGPLGLAGGCLVLILTKLVMTVLTFTYCQVRFKFFKWWDFLFPCALAAVTLGLYLGIRPLVTLHPAVAASLALYLAVLWKAGPKFIGRFPSKVAPASTATASA